ncbi:Crp/Fnr family transcriptional regulator [Nodosilinea sp. E11]|uniref:Crp/Fnr family transcriptional regulator n=1 Tax=Nodosilinea sp. E11 TaxID=3037479 RepID=UPI003977C5C0
MLNSVQRLLFVRDVPMFKELRDDFLVRLASVMDEVFYDSSYTIITEGQEGRSMYIVVSGRVSVHIGGQEVAQLKPGECFGEMSVFDAEPRSASVTTLDSCNCLVLTQQQLYDAIDETPGIAVNVIRLLSRRIRELNQDLNQVKQQLAQTPRPQPIRPQWYRPTPFPPTEPLARPGS